MKTEVIMKRPLMGENVRQSSKTSFISANDIVRAGNKWRIMNNLPIFTLQSWLNTNSTKEFVGELKKQFGDVVQSRRGKNGGTWMHPYIAIDLALAISPKLKIEVYNWLYDELLKYRNYSGNSYQRMAGSLFERSLSKSTFPRFISKIAILIKKECNVKDWETATEAQLRLRDRIHDNIALLSQVMNNQEEAVRIGILEAKKLNNLPTTI